MGDCKMPNDKSKSFDVPFLVKISNYLQTSKAGVYLYELRVKVINRYILWLMKNNGMDVSDGTASIFKYMDNELSPVAVEAGIALRDLYIINVENFLNTGKPLQALRGFTLMSLNPEKLTAKQRKKLFETPARFSFTLASILAGVPSFAARPWTVVSQEEKAKVKSALNGNKGRIWLAAKQHCSELQSTWNNERSGAYNITMLTYNIMVEALCGVKQLDPLFYDYLNQFESSLFNPLEFSTKTFLKTQEGFRKISDSAAAFEEGRDMPRLDQSIVDNIYQHHAKNTTFVGNPQDFNAAALLAITGNLPRLMITLMKYVLTDPVLIERIQQEKIRLKILMNSKSELVELGSEEELLFVIHHSQMFARIYFETLRYSMTVATVDNVLRANTNLFYNQGKKEDWEITDQYSLLPRTLAAIPQRKIAMSDTKYSKPSQFNIDREEYTFCENEMGQISSKSKPTVFGLPDSARVCPAQFFAEYQFYSLLWWLTEHHQFQCHPEQEIQSSQQPLKKLSYTPLEACFPQNVVLNQFRSIAQDNESVPSIVPDAQIQQLSSPVSRGNFI